MTLPREDREDCVIIFVVARTRLDRYEVLHRQFGHSREVRVVLDRRDGERRIPRARFSGANRRRMERRQTPLDLTKLGWSVIETVEPASARNNPDTNHCAFENCRCSR